METSRFLKALDEKRAKQHLNPVLKDCPECFDRGYIIEPHGMEHLAERGYTQARVCGRPGCKTAEPILRAERLKRAKAVMERRRKEEELRSASNFKPLGEEP